MSRDKLEKGQTLSQSERININHASKDELMRLYRVGDDLAEDIIRYREQNGPFEKPEDICNVSGIGPDWYENDAGGQITT